MIFAYIDLIFDVLKLIWEQFKAQIYIEKAFSGKMAFSIYASDLHEIDFL